MELEDDDFPLNKGLKPLRGILEPVIAQNKGKQKVNHHVCHMVYTLPRTKTLEWFKENEESYY